jgi:hypothetical protein
VVDGDVLETFRGTSDQREQLLKLPAEEEMMAQQPLREEVNKIGTLVLKAGYAESRPENWLRFGFQ